MAVFVDMEDDVLAHMYGEHIKLYNKENQKGPCVTQIKSGEVWQNVPKIQ
jgi:hypothetical protein